MSTEGHFCDSCWCEYEHGCVCDMCDDQHTTKIDRFDNCIRVTCTCGWVDRWPVADGSAQQAAAAHKARHQEKNQ